MESTDIIVLLTLIAWFLGGLAFTVFAIWAVIAIDNYRGKKKGGRE
jgi:hypothetical protein